MLLSAAALSPLFVPQRGVPSLSSDAFGLEDNGGQVVVKVMPGEVADGVEQGVEDGIGRFLPVRPHDREHAPHAERFPTW
jgi:hypothetical protein